MANVLPPQTIDYNGLKKFLIALVDQVVQSKDELNSMDAACGDGDFGSTMATAFEATRKILEEESGHDVGLLLASVGTSILSIAGGASGPTVATVFTAAGAAAKGKHELNLTDLASMLDESAQKITLLGGAKKGDKTLMDALEPAVSELRAAANDNLSIRDGLDRAAQAARVGCESTKGLIAKYGRARYLGEQTIGQVDPGAYLIALMFATLAKTSH